MGTPRSRINRTASPRRPEFDYWRQAIGDQNVQPAEWRRLFESGEVGEIDGEWLATSYCRMLDENGPGFGALFREFAHADRLPAVFHCTAGKDRTGVASALLLALLGVPREVAVADYALTSFYTGDRIRAAERMFRERGVDPTKVAALMGADPRWMETAFDHLEAAHGGLDRWLEDRAGLDAGDIAALRERLLD